MGNQQTNDAGSISFVISALGFCIARIGNFRTMFDSGLFLMGSLVLLILFIRQDE